MSTLSEGETDDQSNSELYEPVEKIEMDNFVTVRLTYGADTKKETLKNFIAQILVIKDDAVSCKFIRRITYRNSFHFPNIDDKFDVARDQITLRFAKLCAPPRLFIHNQHSKLVRLLLNDS